MRLLFASDSFKGSISSEKSAQLLTQAAYEVFGDVECISVPIADGGEGSVSAVIQSTGGSLICADVHDPLGEKIKATYGQISTKRAIIEMASASGLTLVPQEERNPLYTTTFGTGEMILDALERGFEEIYIAIGGSATNDGGIGCLKALGVKFFDGAGSELDGCGKDLANIAYIDVSGLDKRVAKTKFTVMCDVTNPLCGPDGATFTFARQKGASEDVLIQLENGMQNYRERIVAKFGIDPNCIVGSGAAGGLGCALFVFLNAKLRSGIDSILEISNFDQKLQGVDFVVTGEGCTDWQSSHGKVLQGIGECCQKYGIPAVAIVGGMGKGAEEIYNHGITSIITTVNAPMSLKEALERAEELYYGAAVRLFRLLKSSIE